MNELGSCQVSVAVLPFTAAGSDDCPVYFSRGFVDDLVTDLARFATLVVFAQHSTSKGDAEQLRADFTLVGSLRLAHDRLRVTVQLLECKTGGVVWAQRFDQQVGDIFAIQDEISAQVVAAVSLRLNDNLTAASKRKPSSQWSTYDYWLQGANLLRQGNVQADEHARGLFTKALEIDPCYGRAYLGLSLSYFNEWTCQLWDQWDENEQRAYDYARLALDHDRNDYFAELVIGRVLLFRREFERAEQHLRRSIALNDNDADALVQVAAAMAYLDEMDDAQMLFARAQRLNPLHEPWYYAYALPIAFIQERYHDVVSYSQAIGAPIMVDLPAYHAAASQQLGNHVEARAELEQYLQQFDQKILHGRAAEPGQALRWLRHINPFRNNQHGARLLALLGAIGDEFEPIPVPLALTSDRNAFCRVGSLWQMSFAGQDVWMPAIKGFVDVQMLLAAPGRKFHCAQLMGIVDSSNDAEVFDSAAKATYKSRLGALRAAMEEADSHNDVARTERLQQEYEALVDHVSSAIDLKGRARKLEAPSERARSAVTQRIKSALKKVSASHPTLGAHLSASVQTGTFCSYQPPNVIEWRV